MGGAGIMACLTMANKSYSLTITISVANAWIEHRERERKKDMKKIKFQTYYHFEKKFAKRYVNRAKYESRQRKTDL